MADSSLEWEALIQKHPGDMQLHALHALRLGLCLKVERGDITLDESTEIFENMRMALISAKEREREDEFEEAKNQKKDL